MNLNKQKEEQYRDRCRLVFNDIVHLIDNLFSDDLQYSKHAMVTKWMLDSSRKTTWRNQIPPDLIRVHIDKFCQPEYYGLLNEKVREYKLKKRIQNESN